VSHVELQNIASEIMERRAKRW